MHGREKRQCKDCGGAGICPHGRVKSRCKECGGAQRTRKPRKAAVESSSSDPDTADDGDDDNGEGSGVEERDYRTAPFSEDEAGGGAAHVDHVGGDRARPALAAVQYS